MRGVLLAVCGLAVVTGCAAPEHAAILSAERPCNLALGDFAPDTREALLFAGRSDWPAVETGYRFDEVTYFSKVIYDYQFGYDRHGGLYYGNETVSSGVLVR